MTTLNTTKLMELFRYLQTFIWLNKNPSTLYSNSFFNWNKSITTWRICLQCQRNCFCPSLQIYKTFKFSFSQCLRTTFKISHLYKAGPSSPAPAHHVHLDVLLLLPRGHAAHLGHQPGVPHPHRAAVPEELRVVLLRVQGQVTRRLNQGKRDEYKFLQLQMQFNVVVTHQAAPRSPDGGPGAAVVGVALAGVDERLLPGHPGPGRPQGGAGSGDGGQGPHPAVVHCEASPAGLRLLKWGMGWVWRDDQGPPSMRRVSHCASSAGKWQSWSSRADELYLVFT